ncbi:asparagine synthetase B, partial [Acinetobacter baumannii]
MNCIEYWGVKQTLENVNGMFALALWDNETNQLTIARDKFGEKPLYYGWQNKTFFFSSELKPIKSNPLFEARINRKALGLFVKYAYIPCP